MSHPLTKNQNLALYVFLNVGRVDGIVVYNECRVLIWECYSPWVHKNTVWAQ